ncbi:MULTISPECIES: TrkH family potassium uptake protein [Aeromicrobium]|uniref:TrkH family potassium uptake protein n=1 Tax=Aeromicrobium TaxID=2040 RepID=UPI002579DF57|nr:MULTISPECIES: potassium transporter TrkG [Aeromicrobium]
MPWGRRRFRLPASIAHPVRLLPLAFLTLILAGTLLLLLPFAREGEADPSFMDAFFTSTSAVTVTGLATVDTGTYWSFIGQAIILVLVEIGGIGIIAMTTLLGLFVGGRLGLRTRLAAQTDMHVVSLGDVGPLFKRVAFTTLIFQGVTAVILTWRYYTGYFDSFAYSLWHGVFDAVMAFNNAGFSLHPDSLTSYAGDYAVILPVSVAVFAGGLGFPVLAELYQEWRSPKTWTIHTRLTIWGSLVLLAVAASMFVVVEWNNAATIGDLSPFDKLVTGIEGGIMTRSGGLASFDWGAVEPVTLFMAIIMMFIGGGSASTAGGIKITTFLLLAYVILAELRGEEQVRIGSRAINPRTIRTALSIALIAVGLVTGGSMALMILAGVPLADGLFESASAFGTVGLSTGLTPELNIPGQLVLIVLMFIGRVGTITAASAFVLRRRQSRYHLPEEQPIIG